MLVADVMFIVEMCCKRAAADSVLKSETAVVHTTPKYLEVCEVHLDVGNREEKRTLLVAFYKVHNPGQVDQVDSIMEAYTLEAIQAACLERYNADPFKPLPTI
ncbi:hypothetical protein CYMTET_22586 [Cymbomonas tetramitiformis]|uniref:Uncharacterized protein n=1 Tax=Cymbomonas tetramitiformis TaxID=36881 RepID=A0AAE0L220_9CHLO|nr:hypothetical protein CYMTET_22586 [Cymbomonas tetramitiformis]